MIQAVEEVCGLLVEDLKTGLKYRTVTQSEYGALINLLKSCKFSIVLLLWGWGCERIKHACNFHNADRRECNGSVVECLTRDRGAAGLSLTGITALWSLSETHLS